jgi:hypothetical protein
VEQKTQNLNPGGGVIGPELSGRNRLATIMIAPPATKGTLQKYTKGISNA